MYRSLQFLTLQQEFHGLLNLSNLVLRNCARGLLSVKIPDVTFQVNIGNYSSRICIFYKAI